MSKPKEISVADHIYFDTDEVAYRFEYDPEIGGMVRTDLLPPRSQRTAMGPTKVVYLRDEVVGEPWRVPAETEMIETRGYEFRPFGEMIASVEVWEPSEEGEES